MAKRCRGWCWQLGLASLLAMSGVLASLGNCALAQIAPDATLGASGSVVTPTAPGSTVDVISGGAKRGANLFHSFEQFSVPTGHEAFFNNAADIQNIISRVTGESISNIDGLIRANASANLFLLNPNGIIFGPNASLSIGGSFVGSTASSLNFADGTQFSATAPKTTSLLTMSVPLGLQFGGNAGSIQVQGNGEGLRSQDDPIIDTTVGLRVQPNQTLALVGDDVALAGGTLKTAGGRIELGSVAGPGLVSLTPIDKGLALRYSGVSTFGDIHLSGTAAVDASGEGGGDIQVRGRRVTLKDGSQIEASTLGAELGGMLNVTASESVELIGTTADGKQFPSGLFSSAYPGATGSGDNLTIETGRLIVRDGAQIIASTYDSGLGGTLAVRATESVEVIGTLADSQAVTGLITSIHPGATGAGGSLTIETGRLILRDGALVIAGTFGQGPGVNLTVTASESVELMGASGLFAQSDYFEAADNAGDAGELTITTRRLIVEGGAKVSASTFTEALGGNLTVTALDSVELMGMSSGLYTESQGAGAAGNLKVETERLTVRNGAKVSVSSESSGKAGNLQLKARSIWLDNSGKLTAQTESGQGGDIKLQAQDFLLLRRGSEISTTAGLAGAGGDGGNIDINTKFIVAVPEENSDITANANQGAGGFIQITAQGVFGIERSEQLTPLSDITAFSKKAPNLNGVIQINTPDVDPSRGLVALPAEPVDASGLIASGCPAGVRQGESQFVITGRGGLPPSPNEVLSSDAVWVDWGTLNPKVENSSSPPVSTNQTATEPAAIVEARGWVINGKGEVMLTANAPNTTPHSPWITSATCHTPQASS